MVDRLRDALLVGGYLHLLRLTGRAGACQAPVATAGELAGEVGARC